MSIILSISSKNSNSLTNFFKFFYLLEKKKKLRLKLFSKQFYKKNKKVFLSVLQSPHVNKKSQEQFEYNVYSKGLNIEMYQLNKLLVILKRTKTKLFSDIQIKFHFFCNQSFITHLSSKKTDYEKFISIILNKRKLKEKSKKKTLFSTNFTKQTLFRLIDIQGESLLKNKYLL